MIGNILFIIACITAFLFVVTFGIYRLYNFEPKSKAENLFENLWISFFATFIIDFFLCIIYCLIFVWGK